jgi:transcriptional regulator with XRE-family HTH domain
MSDINIADQTKTTFTSAPLQGVPRTRTRTIDELVEEIGSGHNQSQLLTNDAADLTKRWAEIYGHSSSLQLNQKARELAKKPAAELLNFLAETGFAWRDIARMVGVSVPAVRKWRQGESPTPQNLFTIATIAALVQILQHELIVTDIASWMEIPLVPGAPTNAIDLVANSLFTEVVGLALEHLKPDVFMDSYIPDWRNRFQSDFEVFIAPDGLPGIRPTSQGDH